MKYDDNEVIDLFMESFHLMCSRDYWRDLRCFSSTSQSLGRVEINRNFGSENVELKSVPIPEWITTTAAAHIRQFVVTSDATELGKVIAAADRLGVRGRHMDEARSHWEQMTRRRFSFRVLDGKSVGVSIGDWFVRWNSGSINMSDTEEFSVSLQDFADVFFHEGLFHPFEPNKRKDKEEVRAVVRSVNHNFQIRLTNLCLSVGIYVSMIIHHQVHEIIERWKGDDRCAEMHILDSLHK